MSPEPTTHAEAADDGRRGFLKGAQAVTLSAAALALLGGCQSMAAARGPGKASDIATLNGALGLEHEAIGIYQLAAESQLLTPGVLKTAVLFQSHHKGHRDALAATIAQLGGSPVEARTQAFYKQRIAQHPLRNQRDVLELAFKLEGIAANAYIGAIPKLGDPTLAKVAGRLVADETMHWTFFATALHKPLPAAALSFEG
ncbi:MAG: ferritin-like domain-containing protein [Bauldia litoralis]